MLVGLSIYDIKNRCTLGFNIQSLVSFDKEHGVSKKDGLYDMVKYLYAQTVSEDFEERSYLPTSKDSPFYTILPWISYSILLPIILDKQSDEAQYHIPMDILRYPMRKIVLFLVISQFPRRDVQFAYSILTDRNSV
jgi:hypothetical protein